MTKEQSEAIERIKYLLFIYKKDDEKGYRATGDVFDTDFKAIETVLNMLKEKEAEIEKYKKLLVDNLAKELNNSIKAKEKADTDLDDLDKGWKVELEKKDKMIDLLVNKLNQNCKVFENSEIKEIVEIYEKIKSTSNLRGIEVRKECIKQYFERKVEDECKR